MAKKVILKDLKGTEVLPITRGELVIDSSGKQALHSNEFLATTSLPGLMSATDKNKLDNFQGDTYELSGVISDDKYITTLTSSKGVTTNAVIEPMQGATVDLAGKVGLVPAVGAGGQNKFLRGDGTWVHVAGGASPDTELDTESANAVENRVIANKINELIQLILTTTQNLYWADLPVKSESDNTTVPTFGGANIHGHVQVGNESTTSQYLLSVQRNKEKLSLLISGTKEGWLLQNYESGKSTALILNEANLIYKNNLDLYWTVYHSGNLTKLSQLNNDLGFVTGGPYLPLSGGTISGYLNIHYNHEVNIASLTATNSSDMAWNKADNISLRLRSSNNAMVLSISGTQNNRVGIIQVGHQDYKYASSLGDLYLNKFGGNVYVGKNLVLDSSNYSSYALSLDGGTMNNTNLVTNLNADLLDGKHDGELTAQYFSRGKLLTKADNINTLMSGIYCYINANNPTGSIDDNVILLAFRDSARTDMIQLAGAANSENLYYRRAANVGNLYENWTNWKTIAFTNSNITGNAGSADKLKNKVTIWGLNFDGSSDIIATMDAYVNVIRDAEGNYNFASDGSGNLIIGTTAKAHTISMSTSSVSKGFHMLNSGNVGIGTTNPLYKLDVNGIANAQGFTLNGATSAGTNYITGTAGRIFFGGNFHLDSLGSNATYINYYTANNVYMCSGSSQGKVGIGTSSPAYKLEVAGSICGTVIYANRDGSNSAGGVSLYSNSDPMTYGIAFRGTGTYGTHGFVTAANDWATYLTMSDTVARGWIFRRGSTNVASIAGNGNMAIGQHLKFSNEAHISTNRSTDYHYGYTFNLTANAQSIGMYSGPIGEAGGVVISPDGCLIYNSSDCGYTLDVHDKDLGTDLSAASTRVFAVTQAHYAWSKSGFQKDGSSDSYVLLGGGGHKAESSLSVNYASSSGTCAGNAKGLYSSGYGNSNLTYYQTDGSFFGNSGWCHYVIANHGNGSNYYNFTLALPFWGAPKYKRLEGGTERGWYTFITTENYTSQLDGRYVLKAGDTMTGTLTIGAKVSSRKATWLKLKTPGHTGSDAWCIMVDDTTDYSIILFGYTASAPIFHFRTDGALIATHFYESSDAVLKTNILDIIKSDKIPTIRQFDWKSDGSRSYGLIAQELEEMGYPELVENSGDHKTVNYSAALSLIVGKLQVKIKELEKEIEILKNK